MGGSPKTARSYNSTIIDDNAVISLNLKWMGQILVFAAVLGWSGYKLLDRLESLEEQMVLADEQITNLLDRHMLEEEGKRAELEEKVAWYEKNINPLSWGKRKKK